jgi:hypothetical protein
LTNLGEIAKRLGWTALVDVSLVSDSEVIFFISPPRAARAKLFFRVADNVRDDSFAGAMVRADLGDAGAEKTFGKMMSTLPSHGS